MKFENVALQLVIQQRHGASGAIEPRGREAGVVAVHGAPPYPRIIPGQMCGASSMFSNARRSSCFRASGRRLSSRGWAWNRLDAGDHMHVLRTGNAATHRPFIRIERQGSDVHSPLDEHREKKLRVAICISDSGKLRVHAALVRPISRPRSSLLPQAQCRAVRLQTDRIDHGRPGLRIRRSRPFHHAEETPVSPYRFQRLYSVLCGPWSLGASRQRSPLRLTRTMPLNTCPSSTCGLPWLPGEIRPQTLHLLICHPVQALMLSLLAEPESDRACHIDGC